jgi:hypothetical protein
MPELSDSALRCVLALLHRSFRFDPADDVWVHAEAWLSRSAVEDASGLSSQGTRNDLAELESRGWVSIDRRGRTHQHRLLLSVPDRRYTYVPTALLDALGEIGSTTELRVLLAVLRGTWGWTETVPGPEGGRRTVHVRWTQRSTSSLAEDTGRSAAAVKAAAQALQGRWIERVRPGHGAYQYRFLPEAIGDGSGDGSGDRSSFSGANAHEIPPDRPNSDPPSISSKESCSHRHSSTTDRPNRPRSTGQGGSARAVPHDEHREQAPKDRGPSPSSPCSSREQPPDLGDLPPEQQAVAEKLANVGLWPERIAEVLKRFCPGRIEANFQLFRQRAAEQTLHSPGAWLYRAITQGFAGYTAGEAPSGASGGSVPPSGEEGALPPLSDRSRVSEAVKSAYVQRGTPESAFHLCKPGSAKPYMYFDPDGDGPRRRVNRPN